MKIICKDCNGTGKLDFQMEDCWFCGGTGYIDNLVYKNNNDNILNAKIFAPKSSADIKYKGNLDAYFKEIESCDMVDNTTLILKDLYNLIKNK